MPGQVHITRGQIETLYELTSEDIIACEQRFGGQAVEFWVLDGPTMQSGMHRSMLLDSEGNLLSDSYQADEGDG